MEAWADSFPAEIMVCDPQGVILGMNETAIQIYAAVGGAALIGRNVFDHHDEPSRSQVRALVGERRTRMYTTQKAGQKKLVIIAPWDEAGAYAGFILQVLDLPENLPNIIKD